jgi:outer membrane protein assembly factor BamE (lipoprotein component of BamABCDE complex)
VGFFILKYKAYLMKKITLFLLLALITLTQGCQTAADHRRAVRDDTDEKVTVGKVQAEIKTGMSGAEVIAILGSPNIVTTDEERREAWVYDKFATETAYSTSSGGVSILVLGLIGDVVAGGAPSTRSSAGAASKTQRTLTIVIKFDKNKKVRDFAYHSSSF